MVNGLLRLTLITLSLFSQTCFKLASARVPVVSRHQIVARATSTSSSPLSLPIVKLLKRNLANNSNDTWVSGTYMESLLEFDYPTLSVFNPSVFNTDGSIVPTETNNIVKTWAALRPANDTTQLALVPGGAAGDPASLGIPFLLAASSGPSKTRANYRRFVDEEVYYLLNVVNRTSDGAISMRLVTEPVQLWSDFVYMVPPFLSFYGVVSENTSILQEAYEQCRIYRQHLRDPKTNLWKHVMLGNWGDPGLWGTGNAWAAAGMTRVLATILHSPYSLHFIQESTDLALWINQILTASFARMSKTDNLLPNYYDRNSTFSDAASSALIAATAFRISLLGLASTPSHVTTAQLIRRAVNSGINKKSGWVSPVVNPLSWQAKTPTSPESEAFVLLLEAAWRDWSARQ